MPVPRYPYRPAISSLARPVIALMSCGENPFAFIASAISRCISLRPSLRLETRVVGIDDGWIPAEANSRRELTALRDGTYTFQVRAVSATGVASEVTSSKFEILPPWWRTPPVILGALLALAPLGYGSYRLRVRTLQRRNAELEDRVSQRTEQLALASAAKTQFVANMSHDIRNPLNGIVGLALALEETPLDDRQRERQPDGEEVAAAVRADGLDAAAVVMDDKKAGHQVDAVF